MSTDSRETIVPQMGAEGGNGFGETVAPLRLSGCLALILGLLSPLSFLSSLMVVIPVAAIVLGAYALRRHGEQIPVGVGAAKIGLVLALGFGSFGFFTHWAKNSTLGGQAVRFGKNYFEVIARDDLELAMELRKDYVNRFPTSMPLSAYYAAERTAMEAAEASDEPPMESQVETVEEFRNDSTNVSIRKRGPGAEWGLGEPIQVVSHYGDQHVNLLWVDPSGRDTIRIRMTLEYRVDGEGDGQWHVALIHTDRDRIVAPSIL